MVPRAGALDPAARKAIGWLGAPRSVYPNLVVRCTRLWEGAACPSSPAAGRQEQPKGAQEQRRHDVEERPVPRVRSGATDGYIGRRRFTS